MMIAWARNSLPTTRSNSAALDAVSSPVRLAADPLIRRSPVSGFAWNTRPRAGEPGWIPE